MQTVGQGRISGKNRLERQGPQDEGTCSENLRRSESPRLRGPVTPSDPLRGSPWRRGMPRRTARDEREGNLYGRAGGGLWN